MSEKALDADAVLMQNFAAGDEAAFRQLFHKYKKQLINFSIRFVGNHFVAEEIVQEVFIKVYRAKSKYSPIAKFSTWIYTIAVNTCLNEMRKLEYKTFHYNVWSDAEKNPPLLNQIYKMEGTASQESSLAASEIKERVNEVLAALPERQRVAFILKRMEEKSLADIADILETSEEAVKSLLNRAKEVVHKKLGDLQVHAM
jgi:RNA polymerase sigma-70 factor (ECF subfamily)